METYGYNPSYCMEDPAPYQVARVTSTHKNMYKIICEHGERSAILKSSIYYNEKVEQKESFPTTGDFVLIQFNESGDSIIVKTLERKTCFSRKDPDAGRGEQVVAANFDYVFILTSLNYDFNLNRLERYLAAAWNSGGLPVILLTKADLIEDPQEKISSVEKIAPGVGVFAISVISGAGIENLSDYLRPKKSIVFLGSSGVGKSTLVNALAGKEIMSVNTIREDDSRGRHTTTHRQLLLLPNGVIVIDTPGMRELGMWDANSGLSEVYSDIEELLAQCKYNNCSHTNEPGCVIRRALAIGALSMSRWNNYQALQKEAAFSNDKIAFQRDKKAFFKKLHSQMTKEKW